MSNVNELLEEDPSHIKVRKVEQILFNEWQRLYRKIRRDPDFPSFTSSIYSKYYHIVNAVTRQTIEQVHRIGIEYVGSKLKQDVYFSNTDVDIIKVQTEFHVNLFFQSLNREMTLLQEKARLKGASDVMIEDPLSGFLAILKRIIISAVTIAYAKSILTKANQLPPTDNLSFTQTNINKHRVRWFTQADERVCKICMPLHNKIFYTDDITTPLPGTMGSLGSHYNCRCYYVLVS